MGVIVYAQQLSVNFYKTAIEYGFVIPRVLSDDREHSSLSHPPRHPLHFRLLSYFYTIEKSEFGIAWENEDLQYRLFSVAIIIFIVVITKIGLIVFTCLWYSNKKWRWITTKSIQKLHSPDESDNLYSENTRRNWTIDDHMTTPIWYPNHFYHQWIHSSVFTALHFNDQLCVERERHLPRII